MIDTWSDDPGYWADVYGDDHEEMLQACEANPDPKSPLGIVNDHILSLAHLST